MNNNEVEVHLYGNYGMFTRVYTKPDKISYPHITISSAESILSCILKKPEFYWEVLSISLLSEPDYIDLRVNESEFLNYKTGKNILRNHKVLKYPNYIVKARVVVPDPLPGERWEGKYTKMFNRRIKQGSCFKTPYFGMRDFEVFFEPVTDELKKEVVQKNEDFGIVLYNMDRSINRRKPTPVFFNSKMENGVINTDPKVIELLHLTEESEK